MSRKNLREKKFFLGGREVSAAYSGSLKHHPGDLSTWLSTHLSTQFQQRY